MKKIFSVLILASFFVGANATRYDVGTVDELKAALNTNKDEYKEIYLTADIDLKDIDDTFGYDYTNYIFWGIFDGQGHKLSNLTYSPDAMPASNLVYSYKNTNYMGLFGAAGSGKNADDPSKRTTFRNLEIENFEVSGYSYVGLLVGYADYCNFENITINIDRSQCSGRAFANSNYVGNIVGWADNSNFKNITIKGTGYVYTSTSAYNAYAGGICGYAENCLFYRCVNHTNVYSSEPCTGGIVGAMKNSTINSCAFDGVVSSAGENTTTGTGQKYTGGLVGDITSAEQAKYNGYCSIRNSVSNCGVVSDGVYDAGISYAGAEADRTDAGCYFTYDYYVQVNEGTQIPNTTKVSASEMEGSSMVATLNDHQHTSMWSLSANAKTPLPTDENYEPSITAVKEVNSQLDINPDAPCYDLQGVRVGSNYRGIVIKGGMKMLQK